MSDRQAQREWKLVKRAFPGEDGPDRLAKAMHANYRARLSEKVSYAFSIPADADAVAVGV